MTSCSSRPHRGVFLAGLVTLLASLAPALTSQALDPAKSLQQYTLDVWRAEDGLPVNSIQALIQDREGYLWIGTQEGLVRFDGARFTLFDRNNTPAMGSSDVRVLFEDGAGGIWIGTNGGGLIHMNNGRFDTFTTHQGLASDFVFAVTKDRDGQLWVGTESGLSRIAGERIESFGMGSGLPSEAVRAIAQDSSGTLWVGTDAGLCALREGRFIMPEGPEDPIHAAVLSIFEDSHHSLWVGTRAGLLQRREGRFDVLTMKDGLPHNEVWTLLEDRDGILWMGTSRGITRLRDGAFETLGRNEGLPYDLVWSLCEDREGSLWVGTSGGGLGRLKDGKFLTYGTKSGLSSPFVWCAMADRRGDVWLGTDTGGLNRIHDGRVTVYTEREGLSYEEVNSLCEDRDGSIWAGTPQGLNHFKDGRFTVYRADDGLPPGRIRALLSDREGALWVGTHGGGLARFKEGRFRTFTTRDGLSSNFIRVLMEDRAGNLWIGTNGGLDLYRDRGFKAYTTANGLSDNMVYSLYEDEEGALWIGTRNGGLNRFEGGQFTAFTTRDGFYDEAVFQILEDGEGRLWMSCNKGVYRVSKRALQTHALDRSVPFSTQAYGKADGLDSRECNGGVQPAGCKTPDGRLWFPTVQGVAVVDPADMMRNSHPPPVLIEALLAKGFPAELKAEVRLPPGRKDLEIRYTALSFLAPSKVLFKYRLEGYDEGWVHAGTRRTAYYTNVPPGHYRFRVIACNNDGVWNEKGASLTLELEPRFYQTLWFYVLCVMVSGGLVVAGFRIRIRRLQLRQAKLEGIVKERTAQLHDANLELERLAREDGLTGIANYRSFQESLDREWRISMRAGTPLSLVMADMDAFKAFNDTYGHLAGDACLKKTARLLADLAKRPGDLPARYGGEEFTLILPDTDSKGAALIADQFRREVASMAVPGFHAVKVPHITISAGVATVVPSRESSPHDLIHAADLALYRSKQEGRNRTTVEDMGGRKETFDPQQRPPEV